MFSIIPDRMIKEKKKNYQMKKKTSKKIYTFHYRI